MIDFVIAWVDGSDPIWLNEKNKYTSSLTMKEDSEKHRYRDWDNLRYWFRSVENNCPWVRTIHFVTWGHLPEWLDRNNPKLNIVNHQDYIPDKYLPTFSSHTIELNLHRIKGLSEHFVYFNDDMFILKKMKENDFFKNGKPCDSAVLNVHCYDMDEMFVMAPYRNIGIINREFAFKNTIKQHFFEWFNWRYGKDLLRNVVLYGCPRFPGMMQQHLPTSFCKSTFNDVWEKYYDILNETCSHKFRSMTDVNQWLIKEWQVASGNFIPRSTRIGKSYVVNGSTAEEIQEAIITQRYKMICLNDTNMEDEEFRDTKRKINKALEKILPIKSGYERKD